jgi:hypothetical protein
MLTEPEQCGEQAGVQHGQEHERGGNAVARTSVATVDQRPPEQRRRREERQMLHRVYPLVGERCIE